MNPLVVYGCGGLGDNIYQRPFIRAAAQRWDLYLSTPWPELYSDIDIRFIRYGHKLRTQMKNVARQSPGLWCNPPSRASTLRLFYGMNELRQGSITRAFERQMPLHGNEFKMDLPALPHSKISSVRPIAFVRPATVRKEWRNEARNPKPEYIAQVCEWLKTTHTIVLVADLQEGEEWLFGPKPFAHIEFMRGELTVMEMLALFSKSDIVVGGVGWIVPAAMALKKDAFIILGGQGGHNAPEKVLDPRVDCSNIVFARPARFCGCTNMLHACDKTINDLERQFKWRSKRNSTSTSTPQKCLEGSLQ